MCGSTSEGFVRIIPSYLNGSLFPPHVTQNRFQWIHLMAISSKEERWMDRSRVSRSFPSFLPEKKKDQVAAGGQEKIVFS